MRTEVVCEFVVFGKAASRGSKRIVRNRFTGKSHMIDQSKNSYKYMASIKDAAFAAMDGKAPESGPVLLYWLAEFKRPKSHYRKSGLAPSAPEYYTQTPDCSKIVRGIEDAMTGVCYVDDKQITGYATGSGKIWTEGEPCTRIRVLAVRS